MTPDVSSIGHCRCKCLNQIDDKILSLNVCRGRNLRSDVVWSSTEGPCGVPLHHALPAHAKVGNLDVPLTVQQDVIQLQIST